MIPPGHHCDRPLELRQPFIFYLGHLPAFADARLAGVLQEPLTEPAPYADLFARGIDPDLDDPTLCECDLRRSRTHLHTPRSRQSNCSQTTGSGYMTMLLLCAAAAPAGMQAMHTPQHPPSGLIWT